MVAFGDAAAVTLVTEDQREVFNSYHGRGCRPTRAWVRAMLREHFPHVYTTATQPWHEEFPIDWSRPNDRSPVSRAVFVASRAPIHDTRLVEDLPVKQTRP